MTSSDSFKTFQTQWELFEVKLKNTLWNKYKWSNTHHKDIWEDILSEAKVLCAEHYDQYDASKGEIGKFFYYWSEKAYQRVMEDLNRVTLGNPSFLSIQHRSNILLQTIQDEGNPYYLIAFLFKYYLDIHKKEFVDRGFHHRSLKDLFDIIERHILSPLDERKYPSWLKCELEGSCKILWGKIKPKQHQLFLNNERKPEQVFDEWAKEVKGNFLKTRSSLFPDCGILNPFFYEPKKHSTDASTNIPDDILLGNEPYLTIDPFATPSAILSAEEQVQMMLKLLQYTIHNISDIRYLFALLFNLCSTTLKNYSRLFNESSTVGEVYKVFKEEYLNNSSLAESKLIPVFQALEEKIKKIENEIFIDDPSKLNFADWAYKAKMNIRTMIFTKNDPLSVELRTFYSDKSKIPETKKRKIRKKV